ncbi:MAG: NADH-quinone oxidoreductase subunit NuoE [Nitrospinota bacterium]
MLSKNAKKEISNEISKFPEKKAVLLPALHIAQKEQGWISKETMEEIAAILEIKPIEVMEVVSFYTMFNMNTVGKYHLQVCTNLSCSLLNSKHMVNYLQDKLGIKTGETTKDNKFTLSTVECLGSCGTSPMMQVNDEFYENLTKQKIDALLENLK